MARTYVAIDLKSFYASVECVERGLDPLSTNLVVGDNRRTSKTICLAVTPPLKKEGVAGRPRLFEVEERVKYINALRRQANRGRDFVRKSYHSPDLKKYPCLELDYIVAPPRMALYIDYSRRIYSIYLRHVAPEDIHVYSVDEVFMDLTPYLATRKVSAHDFTKSMIREVLRETGITATAGIGTNLYLAKVAMDIVAKRIEEDPDGVRIAQLDEMSYRHGLWDHRPLTDFWRVGGGYARKLEGHGIYTMGDLARRSLEDEEIFYKLFGINGELLIDHAWGVEPCTISDIKAYRPRASSLGAGQVLQRPYPPDQARVVVWEMGDQLALDLVSRGYVTDQVDLTLSFDKDNLRDPETASSYRGPISKDAYGRPRPRSLHSSRNLPLYTSSSKVICQALLDLFDFLMGDQGLLVRKISVRANHTKREGDLDQGDRAQQLDLFGDWQGTQRVLEEDRERRDKEKRLQEALIRIKRRFGKNAIMKGANLQEGATARERNKQIGGHKA